MSGGRPSLLLGTRSIALDRLYPTLNSTLDARVERLILAVVTQDYLPLLFNFLCSVGRWSSFSDSEVLVASADSWLCDSVRRAHPSVHCVEPSFPSLASAAVEAYALKLQLAARAVERGHEILFADCATVLLDDPFVAARASFDPPPALLLSFQDKACVPPGECASRRASPPDARYASTIMFMARGRTASVLLEQAARLLSASGELFGDQEALRTVLTLSSISKEPPKWHFLPANAFVRSMVWLAGGGGVAGHDDAGLFRKSGALVGYASGMTQRGLSADERVALKQVGHPAVHAVLPYKPSYRTCHPTIHAILPYMPSVFSVRRSTPQRVQLSLRHFRLTLSHCLPRTPAPRRA